MQNIKKCEKILIAQGASYFGKSTEVSSVGYLELKPYTSLNIHNRIGGIEHLTQVKGACIVTVFNTPKVTNHLLKPMDKLSIEPEGVFHIHVNPFEKVSLTYWYFEGDIRHIIEDIKSNQSKF